MAKYNLFSKRQKLLRGEVPDVYVYDTIPRPLRVQLVQIINEGIGPEHHIHEANIYNVIHKTLCREYGVFSLSKNQQSSDWECIANYLLKTEEAEEVIDIVEICLRVVETEFRNNAYKYQNNTVTADDAINEVNERFKEHGIGYEYVSREIIRIDSQLIHNEVVKPTLAFLAQPEFAGANEEFLKAHEHYRHGNYKECLVECLKAFESTMKIICELKGWNYSPKDTAKTLIDTCISNNLFPSFMQSHVGNLRSILESGLPTLRNKHGGHGQGSNISSVTEATARFALHTTASNILFFIEASQTLP